MHLQALSDYLIPCPIKESTGFDCPGCGMQRSFLALVQGDLPGSLALHPALIPFIITWVLLFLHLRYKFTHGSRWILVSFSVTVGIMFVNFIIKTIIHLQNLS